MKQAQRNSANTISDISHQLKTPCRPEYLQRHYTGRRKNSPVIQELPAFRTGAGSHRNTGAESLKITKLDAGTIILEVFRHVRTRGKRKTTFPVSRPKGGKEILLIRQWRNYICDRTWIIN